MVDVHWSLILGVFLDLLDWVLFLFLGGEEEELAHEGPGCGESGGFWYKPGSSSSDSDDSEGTIWFVRMAIASKSARGKNNK